MLQGTLGRDSAVDKTPKDLARYAGDTLVLADSHAKLDSLRIGVRAGILGKRKEHRGSRVD